MCFFLLFLADENKRLPQKQEFCGSGFYTLDWISWLQESIIENIKWFVLRFRPSRVKLFASRLVLGGKGPTAKCDTLGRFWCIPFAKPTTKHMFFGPRKIYTYRHGRKHVSCQSPFWPTGKAAGIPHKWYPGEKLLFCCFVFGEELSMSPVSGSKSWNPWLFMLYKKYVLFNVGASSRQIVWPNVASWWNNALHFTHPKRTLTSPNKTQKKYSSSWPGLNCH